MLLGGLCLAGCLPAIAAEGMRVFAAGSLRQPLDELLAAFEAKSGVRFGAAYRPSGKLRQAIEQGDVPEVFASAAIEHTQALFTAGRLRSSRVLTRNEMCLLAAGTVRLTQARLSDIMLDPSVKLGTSTPRADPSSDYAWQLFRNIDQARPGAYAVLDAKALKLLGAELAPAQTESPYLAIFRERKADVFVTYCTNAVATVSLMPGLNWARFPDAVNVAAVYGIGVGTLAPREADALVDFILSAEGRKIFGRYGFK